MAVEAVGVKTDKQHEGWHDVMRPAKEDGEGYVVFKIDAPDELTKITQGARMYVRAALRSYGRDVWKGAGLLFIMSLPPRMARKAYLTASRGRHAITRLVTGYPGGSPLPVLMAEDVESPVPEQRATSRSSV